SAKIPPKCLFFFYLQKQKSTELSETPHKTQPLLLLPLDVIFFLEFSLFWVSNSIANSGFSREFSSGSRLSPLVSAQKLQILFSLCRFSGILSKGDSAVSEGFAQEMMNRDTTWTKEENKKFERALAVHVEDTPDRWFKIASVIPGKTVSDVMNQYIRLEEDVSDIESGRIPIPGYPLSSCRFDQAVSYRDLESYRKRANGSRGTEQERKKGVPWTEEEHRRFLLGLLKYGKGDWRNISRNFVVSKTPTQVASHAQKYYQRQLSGAKDKRRPSIHDITTVNLLNANSSCDQNRPFPDGFLPQTQEKSVVFRDMGAENVTFLGQSSLFPPSLSPYEAAFLDGIKFSGQISYGSGAYSNIKSRNSVF
ncbi:PREDICTED: transcription factor DIVARICATA-like, partial [Tarenaya hassleriana]|uniref:transcription factor DIVARICATA-like n=1 Tax=Tarenaya hassleriana TaxID=28532 RepID=UPI0008FD2785